MRLFPLLLAVALFGFGAVVATGGDAPIASSTVHDATGDAGGGPDISSLAITVNADQTVTFSATLSNRSSLLPTESLQFFIRTATASGYLNIAAFQTQATELAAWTGTTWRGQHEIPSTWTNGTFTTRVPLADLQDALQAPVRPVLFVSVESCVGATPGALPVAVDAAPDTGDLGVNTVAEQSATTTTTEAPPPTTTTAPAPAVPTGARPRWSEKIVRLAHERIEWKRLVIVGIPAHSRVSFACTKGCRLSEHPGVVRGRAVSKRFAGVPFRRGVSYRVEIVQPDKTGWWWRTTVLAKPAGEATATALGCIASNGARVPLSAC